MMIIRLRLMEKISNGMMLAALVKRGFQVLIIALTEIRNLFMFYVIVII